MVGMGRRVSDLNMYVILVQITLLEVLISQQCGVNLTSIG